MRLIRAGVSRDRVSLAGDGGYRPSLRDEIRASVARRGQNQIESRGIIVRHSFVGHAVAFARARMRAARYGCRCTVPPSLLAVCPAL
jgi:hypothetical protein